MKLRVVVIGAGLMGEWHAKAIEHIGGSVVAVCDRNLAAAERLAAKFKNARAVAAYSDAMDNGVVDVVHLCTPPETHVELASAALTQGLHVLVEKPLAPSAAETAKLYELASRQRRLICPVHQFSFQQGVQRALQKLSELGQIRHVNALFCSAGAAGKTPVVMNAVVSDILPHPLALFERFVPGAISSKDWTLDQAAPGELRASLNSRGIGFSILISMNSRPTSTSLQVLGTSGTLHADLFHGFSMIEPGDVSRWRKIVHPFDLSTRTFLAAATNLLGRTLRVEPAYPGLRDLIRKFYQAIAAGEPSPIGQAEAIAIASVRDLFIGKTRSVA